VKKSRYPPCYNTTMLEINSQYELEELLMHGLASFLEIAEGDEDFVHSYIQHILRENEE